MVTDPRSGMTESRTMMARLAYLIDLQVRCAYAALAMGLHDSMRPTSFAFSATAGIQWAGLLHLASFPSSLIPHPCAPPQTIRIMDLLTNATLATINHDTRIDWLELNHRGTHLLFRDKKRHLSLFNIQKQERTTLLNYAGYVQWVPQVRVPGVFKASWTGSWKARKGLLKASAAMTFLACFPLLCTERRGGGAVTRQSVCVVLHQHPRPCVYVPHQGCVR